MNKLDIFKHKNLRCCLIKNPFVKTISMNIFIKVGSRNEINKKAFGSSHMLEHLLFKGSEKFKNYKEISKELETLGEFNATTTSELTNFFIKCRNNNIERVFNIFSDMLLKSSITNKSFDDEKGIVKEELKRIIDDSGNYILDILNELILDKHEASHSVAGTLDIIQNYNRNDVYKYYKKHYNLNNFYLILVGNYPNNIKDLIKKYFNEEKNGIKNKIPKQIELKQSKIRTKILNRQNLEQTHLAIGFPVFNMYDDRRFSLEILANIIGGGMSSLLFQKLREEAGLTYNVNCGIHFLQDTGYLYIITSIDNNSLFLNINKGEGLGALPIILNTIFNLQITQEMLNLTKESIKNTITFEQENTMSITEFYGTQLIFEYKKIITLDEIEKYYNKISLDDLNNLAKSIILKEKLNITVIGNLKNEKLNNFLGDYFKKEQIITSSNTNIWNNIMNVFLE